MEKLDLVFAFARHLRECRSIGGDDNRANQLPSFDTTTENDREWDQRNRGGDAGLDKDHSG